MIVRIGIDLVSIKQAQRLVNTWGDRFLNKVFTPAEVASGKARPDPASEFAAWFAAKEAVQKALGAGIFAGVNFKSIEVIAEPGLRPEIRLSGPAQARAEQMNADAVHLSLTHEEGYAAAMAVIENRGGAK